MKDNLLKSTPEPLLKPSKVAELLNMSEKTVYKHRKKLYGFKPAGLGILRFRKEIIYGIMEGQDPKALVLQFPVSETIICGKRIQNQKRSCISKRGKKKDAEKPTETNRHGLLGSM